MNSSFTPDGRLHSPFRIFIKDLPTSEIGAILQQLGLGAYRPKPSNSMDRQIAWVDLDHWTLFADDWFYTLWRMPTTDDVVQQISINYCVYTDLVGDCDESYGFALLSGGEYVRRLQVDSPGYSDQQVTVDIGSPLEVESSDRHTNDIEGYVDGIAKSIGIRLPASSDCVVAFGPPD